MDGPVERPLWRARAKLQFVQAASKLSSCLRRDQPLAAEKLRDMPFGASGRNRELSLRDTGTPDIVYQLV
jgi:hypothetical protein